MTNENLKRFPALYHAYCNQDLNMMKKLLSISEYEEDFVGFLNNFLDKHGIQKNTLLQKSYIPIKYGYKIINGSKHTNNRDVIVRIALAAGMNLEETNRLLYLNSMPGLDYQSKRDSLIICSIQTKGNLKLETLNDWLIELNFKPIIE